MPIQRLRLPVCWYKSLKKHSYYLLPLLFTCVLFASCEEDDTRYKTSSLMPIETGNSWTYTATTVSDYGRTIQTFKYTIGQKIRINGYTCYVKQREDTPGSINQIQRDSTGNIILYGCAYLIGNDDAGNVVQYGGLSEVDTLIIPSIEYKKNAQVGDEWDCSVVSMDWNNESFNESTKTVKCVSEDTLITTPKGNFHCMAFETPGNSSNIRTRRYYSVNVGEVRFEFILDGVIRTYTELIDYTLNQ